jgi:PAS domain S-box-containing protein
MNKTEPRNNDALLQRLEELERDNEALRAQLRQQNPRSHADAIRHSDEASLQAAKVASDHAQELAVASSHIRALKQSHTSLRANEELLRESEKQLRASEEKLRQITDNLPALIGYVDADQRYRFNNKAYESWIGRSPESLYGVHLRDAVGEKAYERVRPYVEAALSGKRTGHEWWAPFPDRMRFVKSEYIPDRREDGSIAGFYVLASDLTEFKQSEAALAKSEARLRLAIDAGRMAVWETETVTQTITSSPELNRLLGFPPDASPTTEEIRSRYYPGERERLRAVAVEALARGERYAETELRIIWPDGSLRWLLLRAELLGVTDGVPARTLGVALDITERKKAEEHQQLLINELNHRVKNTLATVQSIATQSLRNADTAAAARDAVEGRLFALSRAHDVLTRENWDGASLLEVVQKAIEPFQGHGDGRFTIQGPDVRLPPRIALAAAMALQELGTNAVKYGALSNETGHVRIDWTLTGQADTPRLEMCWRETGGPPVTAPDRRGFGTRLIERSLAQELHGEVEITFAPTGVVCSINAPLRVNGEATGEGSPA